MVAVNIVFEETEILTVFIYKFFSFNFYLSFILVPLIVYDSVDEFNSPTNKDDDEKFYSPIGENFIKSLNCYD